MKDWADLLLFPVLLPIVLPVLGAAGLVAGCGDSFTLPPSPDMSALVATYQNPTGTIDPTQLAQIMSDAQMKIAQLHPEWLPDLVATALTRLRSRLADSGLSTDPTETANHDTQSIDAVLTIMQICKGWADPIGPVDAAQNGSFQFTAVVEDGRVRQTMGGTASMCDARLQPTNNVVLSTIIDIKAFLDGTLNLYLYSGLPTSVADTDVLVQVMGQIGTMGSIVSGSFDFHLIYPNVEVSLTRPDGNIIVSVGLSGVTLRGQNATYQCNSALQTCTPS